MAFIFPLAAATAADPSPPWGVRSTSVCSAITDEGLAGLASLTIEDTVEPGIGFMAEEEPASHVFNVTSGTVRLFKLLPDGRRQIIGFARAGYFLGLVSAGNYTVSAEAVDAVTLCRCPRARLQALATSFPLLEHLLLETTVIELAAAQEGMLLLGRKTARERVASFLLGWAAGGRPFAPPLRYLHLPMPRGDIADYLGLTVETVSRTLTKLRTAHLVAMPAPLDIELLRPDALAAIAAGQD